MPSCIVITEALFVHRQDIKTVASQEEWEILAVNPHMIMLAEGFFPLLRLRDGRVFKGGFQIILLRNREDAVPPRAGESSTLPASPRCGR